MSTPDTKTHHSKHYTPAEIETLLSAAPHAAVHTCEQLCEALQEDATNLEYVDTDFPANRRAAVRKAILRDMVALRAQMQQQKCPNCPE